jgi:RecA-family ATPase
MRSLLQVVRGTSEAGRDLPEILPALTAATIKFRRGQLHVIAGQPGRGKTLMSLWYGIKSNCETLYFSADSDEGTIANRASAVLLNKTVDEIKSMRQTEAVTVIEDELFELSKRLRLQPDPHPDIDAIFEEVESYVELFGRCPELVIIDNLMNVAATHDNEWTGYRDNLRALHTLARETESSVVVLHHTSEDSSKPNKPGPMKSLMGKANQLPETILTVAMDGDEYHVAAVKNRDGEADPNAERPVTVYVDAPSMSLFNTRQELDMARTRRQWQ